MKKYFLIALLLLSYGLYSQEERTPEQIAQKLTEVMHRDLSLTSNQLDTIYKIQLRYAYMRKPQEPRDSVLRRMSIMQSEILPLLSEEQRWLWQEKQAKKRVNAGQSHRMKRQEAKSE